MMAPSWFVWMMRTPTPRALASAVMAASTSASVAVP